MGKLVQLETPNAQATRQVPADVPALSQSKQAAMACSAMYRHLYIEGKDQAYSAAADRGTAVHEAIAAYVRRLVETKRATDFEFLDGLIAASSEEVAGILERFKDSFIFDPEKVLDAEMWIGLDEHLLPVTRDSQVHREGTLDLVQLTSSSEALIDDWKSYWQVVDADTFQSKFYPFLLMCINPAIQKVTFRLRFVRYGDATREVTYTRADMPRLKKLVEHERARQLELHARALTPQEFEARPGRQCMWCPLLNNGCPIATVNPFLQQTPEQRVKLALYLAEAAKQNTAVLKDMMVERGPITYRDEIGTEYVARFEPSERRSYPLEATAAALEAYWREHPSDADFADRLTVGGLSSPLKAKKREALRKELAGVADVRVSTRLKVGRPGEVDEDDGE